MSVRSLLSMSFFPAKVRHCRKHKTATEQTIIVQVEVATACQQGTQEPAAAAAVPSQPST